jgi:hypothetical protein
VTGFSGVVPADQGTSTIKIDNFSIGKTDPEINFLNLQNSILVSLNGRTIHQGISSSGTAVKAGLSTGLWIGKQNNSKSAYINIR